MLVLTGTWAQLRDDMAIIGFDLFEATSSTLHKVHPAENISDYRIVALRRNIIRIKILND